MSDVTWSLGISLFYVGYIISQIPANVIIAKGSPRVLLPACMMAWSCVTICMPAVSAGWGFCLCRFLIGLVEGPFVPAVSLMTSSWYTKHESPLRMGIWHAGNTISQALSGLLAAGILTNMEGVADLRAWKWFLLLEGIVSILVAAVSFWFIPNFPDSTGTYFITEEEAQMAQYRQAVSAGGLAEDDTGGYWDGFWMCMKDPFSHLFAAIHFALIIGQSYKDFFPSIVATLGFSGTTTYLIQAPPPVIAFLVTLAISWSSGKRLEHGYHIIVPILFTIVGCAVMITTLNVGARYFCMILLVVGPFVGLNVSHPAYQSRPLMLTATASNLLGNHRRSSPPYKACGPYRIRQLCLLRVSLVHALLLPSKPGALLSDWWRCYHCRLWPGRHLCFDHEMVCQQEEQAASGGRGCGW